MLHRNWNTLDAICDRLLRSRNPHERNAIYVGRKQHGGFPVFIDEKLLREHMHVIGPPGTGKTSLVLEGYIRQFIRRNNGPVVIIDCKGGLGDRAGLLEGSALPGEGTSFVAAHNHLNNLEAGPFLFINELAENDRVFVRDVFGKLIEYSVYANELFEPDEFAAVQEKAAEFTNALVLITCENESSEGGYLNRRVVFAKPL